MSTLTGLIGGGGSEIFGLQNVTNAQSGAATQNNTGLTIGTSAFVSVPSTNSWQTMLSVNASGYLLSISWLTYHTSSSDWRFRVKVDGTQIINLRLLNPTGSAQNWLRVWPNFYENSIGQALTQQQVQNAVCPIRFDSSLLIEGYKSSIFNNSAMVSYVLAS